MRTILVVFLSASLFACRTSDLGSCSKDGDCSSGAACDLAARVCVATDAPSFANIAVSTPAAFTDSTGRAFFDTTGGPLSVSASITGRAGVDPASACLKVSGETGACAHQGIAGSGNTFTFSLPRPSGSFDGTTPLDFTISAASPSARQSTSAVQHVYFDNQPPAIAVVTDSTPYARTLPDGGAAPITVSAIIADGAGVASAQLLSGSTQVSPASSAGNEYTFHLNPAAAPADTEGAYTFQVRAVDALGHASTVEATRTIDDAPPEVGTIKIYKGDIEPSSAGVTYPALAPNTGWTGNTFIYNDTVHVKGTISDISGVGPATLRVDGIDLSSGTSTGTPQSLGCSASSTTCSFNVSVQLNDPQNGAFHTGAATTALPGSTALIPSGLLHVVIEAEDNVSAFGGTAAHHAAPPRDTPVRATRLLWSKTLTTTAGSAVSGLAIHPSGDVIATTDGGLATVYDMAADQPMIRWNSGTGGVIGPPAVGSGEAADAGVYIADEDGFIRAFTPAGAPAWSSSADAGLGANTFFVGPAVAPVTISGNAFDEVIAPDNSSAKLWGASAAYPDTPQNVDTGGIDEHSSPLVVGNGVWFGVGTSAGGGIVQHSIAADGTLGAVNAVTGAPSRAYYGLSTDGTQVFGATRRGSTRGGDLIAISLTRTILWDDMFSSTTAPTLGLSGEPILRADSTVVVSSFDPSVWEFAPVDGAGTKLLTASSSNSTRVALLGWDRQKTHLYLPSGDLPSGGSVLYAYAYGERKLSWLFNPPATMLRFAMMDCQGRLFVAGGATVYALISDDKGLADTPWPAMRRDARNSGNAGAPKYGILPANGNCTQ